MENFDINKYKNIIFDLGGVILNIDYNLTKEAFKKLGLSNFDELFSQANQTNLFDLYEKGKITSIEFVNSIKEIIGNHISDDEIVNAWNAMLLDLPENRVKLLSDLNGCKRLFLLSNTNEIHKIAYCSYLQQKFGFLDFSHLFEKQYLSFEIGMRKPDKEIFQHVIDENMLIPEETLFIDDSIQHVKGAKEVGIEAFHLSNGLTIQDLF